MLIDWVGGSEGKIFGPRSCTRTEHLIFSRPAWPNSVNKNFIIWPPLFSLFYFILLWVIKSLPEWSLTSLILTEKSGFILQQSRFSSHLAKCLAILKGRTARAIVYGPHTGIFLTVLEWKRARGRTGHMINFFFIPRQALVVQRVDSTLHWINHYPAG